MATAHPVTTPASESSRAADSGGSSRTRLAGSGTSATHSPGSPSGTRNPVLTAPAGAEPPGAGPFPPISAGCPVLPWGWSPGAWGPGGWGPEAWGPGGWGPEAWGPGGWGPRSWGPGWGSGGWGPDG